jgi:hypothetical protein
MVETLFHTLGERGVAMPSPRPSTAGARGPVAREPAARPCGFRITDEQRAELLMAARFRNCDSLQSVIDLAVSEFLNRTRRRAGYQDALANSKRGVAPRR